MQFKIETQIEGDNLNVRLGGDFDMESVPAFRTAIQEEQDSWCRVVIHMGDIDFMDSSGLQELVRLEDRLRAFGLEMILTQLSVPVRRLFELTGLDSRFTVRD